MFILKSAHEARIAELTDSYKRQVAVLEARIDDLRQLVFSPTKADVIPVTHHEADLILTQNEEPIPTEEEKKELEQTLMERDRIFSGNFDGVS